MAPNTAYEVADKLFVQAKDPESLSPFAGCPVLFGGDLRQLSPICGPGEVLDEIHFRHSDLLQQCRLLHLRENMRANADERDFADLLKTIGEGTHESPPELPPQSFVVPDRWVVGDNSLDSLIEWVFGADPSTECADSTILTQLNEDCRKINNRVLLKMKGPGEIGALLSEDTVLDDDPANPIVDNGAGVPENRRMFEPEELHDMNPSGVPYHELLVRKGAIAILIRNLDIPAGIVNGTRVRIEDFSRNKIRVKVLTGKDKIRGKVIDLPRIAFVADIGPVIKMQRVQFPIRIAYAMTINKAQGLTLRKVGVYLRRYLSDHGKLYVSLSRVRHQEDVRMVIVPDDRQGFHTDLGVWFTHNPVRRSLWDLGGPRPQPRVVRTPPPPPVLTFTGHDNFVIGPVAQDDGHDTDPDDFGQEADNDNQPDDAQIEEDELSDEDNYDDQPEREWQTAQLLQEMIDRERQLGIVRDSPPGSPNTRLRRRLFGDDVLNELLFDEHIAEPEPPEPTEPRDFWAPMTEEELEEANLLNTMAAMQVHGRPNTPDFHQQDEVSGQQVAAPPPQQTGEATWRDNFDAADFAEDSAMPDVPTARPSYFLNTTAAEEAHARLYPRVQNWFCTPSTRDEREAGGSGIGQKRSARVAVSPLKDPPPPKRQTQFNLPPAQLDYELYTRFFAVPMDVDEDSDKNDPESPGGTEAVRSADSSGSVRPRETAATLCQDK